ncbi:MAG: carboxypeptidase-like regulatory domain-containing protein [Rhizobacter sp.]|nr:carboxypeptidase-like regulatory domain-containing protein [Chlorobiales bacterium]
MKALALILIMLLLSLDAFAQDSTGTIIGKVIDKDTREKLIGASVRIEGTRLGGSTNVNGQFKILNVPTATYSVRASYVGYKDVTVRGLKVTEGLTSETPTFELPDKGYDDTISCPAYKPLLEKTQTTSMHIYDRERISHLPW